MGTSVGRGLGVKQKEGQQVSWLPAMLASRVKSPE